MEGFEGQLDMLSPEQEKLAKLSAAIRSSIQKLIESNVSFEADEIFETAKKFVEDQDIEMSNKQIGDLIKEISDEERSK